MKRALLVTIVLVGLAAPTSASGQTGRSWVSGDGLDANECSFSLPCKTFSRAMEQLAEGGEINARSSGSFGELAIDRSMTIDGRGHNMAITGFANAIDINAPGKKVTLRHLHITGFAGSNDGINIISAAHVRLRDVTIRHMDDHGIDFRAAPMPPASRSRSPRSRTTG